jgi:transposase, IS5 family
VIERSRCPLPSGGGPIAEDVAALWEGWMRHVDELLVDEELVELVFDALARRWTHSRTRGRRGTPADVVLRLLVLKHVRNWSYGALEREVRANLVYRQFTHVGAGKVPDAKTLGRIGLALGPAVVERLHQRVVTISRECGIVQGRRMRVDTTVVETNIHYPTDASLLSDGVRVLTRTMKKITKLAGAAGTVLRDRSRSTQRCLIQIGRAARSRSDQGKQRLQQCYRRLLAISGRVAGQAKRFAQEVASGCKRSVDLLQQMTLQGHRAYIETMLPLVKQVMRQTRQRINHGNTHSPGKIVSLFEPHTEIIRKGKAGKPTEFGKMVKIQEVEQQIVTHYEVYDRRPADSDLVVPALELHKQQFGHAPKLMTTDAGFFSAANEAAARDLGVKRISMPNRSSKSPQRRLLERKRWFREAQRWRTGCEGRISLLKRRHGLNRCRYKGEDGMRRWVGLGVIADNLINIGQALNTAGAE